jgi:hypothetical protein
MTLRWKSRASYQPLRRRFSAGCTDSMSTARSGRPIFTSVLRRVTTVNGDEAIKNPSTERSIGFPARACTGVRPDLDRDILNPSGWSPWGIRIRSGRSLGRQA